MNVYDNMMLDLLFSSKSASNCQNNAGNKKKKIFLQKLLYEKETHSPIKVFYLLSLQTFGLIFTFG